VPSNQSVNLTQVGGSAIALGQTTMAASLPVAIASNQSTLPISAASLPLPTGAATSALQTQISGQLPATLGQKAMAASLAVCLASDQSAIAVTQSGTWNINNISGTISLPTGAATAANQSTTNTTLSAISGQLPATLGQKAMAASLAVTLASDQSALAVTQSGTWNINNISGTVSLPTGAATSANQTTINTNITGLRGQIPTSLGQTTMGASMSVTVASDQSAIPVTSPTSSSAALSNVSGSATSVTVLASNASRKNATFYNDSTATLYLKFGSTAASTTSYTVQIPPNGYYELPNGSIYTGQLTGIWSAANGAVRVTELT
jgi:peroxiredoxin